MEKYGFEPRFPPQVMDEVNAMQERTFVDLPKDTRDLRALLWSSIDDHDSQDLDQLEYCERMPDGTDTGTGCHSRRRLLCTKAVCH